MRAAPGVAALALLITCAAPALPPATSAATPWLELPLAVDQWRSVDEGVYGFAPIGDTTLVAVADREGVRIWNWRTDEIVAGLPDGSEFGLEASPDGRFLRAGTTLVDLAAGATRPLTWLARATASSSSFDRVARIAPTAPEPGAPSELVLSSTNDGSELARVRVAPGIVRFTPDGERLVVAGGRAVELRDAHDGHWIARRALGAEVTDCVVSGDGRLVAVSLDRAPPALLELTTLRPEPPARGLAPGARIAFSPTGARYVAFVPDGADGLDLDVRDARSHARVLAIHAPPGIDVTAPSPRWLATLSTRATLVTDTIVASDRYYDADTGEPLGIDGTAVHFARDGTRIGLEDDPSGSCSPHDLVVRSAAGEVLRRFHAAVRPLAFEVPHGDLIAASPPFLVHLDPDTFAARAVSGCTSRASRRHGGCGSGDDVPWFEPAPVVRATLGGLWVFDGGGLCAPGRLRRAIGYGVAVSADGSAFVATDLDGRVLLHDTDTDAVSAVLGVPRRIGCGDGACVALAPDGSRVVIATDHEITAYRSDGTRLARARRENTQAVRFSPSGRVVLAGGRGGALGVLDGASLREIARTDHAHLLPGYTLDYRAASRWEHQFSEDERSLAVSSWRGVVFFELGDHPRTSEIPLPSAVDAVELSADGALVLAEGEGIEARPDERHHAWIVRTQGGEVRPLQATSPRFVPPAGQEILGCAAGALTLFARDGSVTRTLPVTCADAETIAAVTDTHAWLLFDRARAPFSARLPPFGRGATLRLVRLRDGAVLHVEVFVDEDGTTRVVPSDADGMLGDLDGLCRERATQRIDAASMHGCVSRPALDLQQWVER